MFDYNVRLQMLEYLTTLEHKFVPRTKVRKGRHTEILRHLYLAKSFIANNFERFGNEDDGTLKPLQYFKLEAAMKGALEHIYANKTEYADAMATLYFASLGYAQRIRMNAQKLNGHYKECTLESLCLRLSKV